MALREPTPLQLSLDTQKNDFINYVFNIEVSFYMFRTYLLYMVYFELGRTPLYVDRYIKMIRF